MKTRPKILTVAGFDPSGGAGVLADIKTFEQYKCLGFAVQTSNTVQTESEFYQTNWIDEEQVFYQLQILLDSYEFQFVKVGLIPGINFLKRILDQDKLKNTKVIWDPILATSSGFDFGHDLSELKSVLNKVFMITPNWLEIGKMAPGKKEIEGALELSQYSKVYLKGGHNPESLGRDYLFQEGNQQTFNPKGGNYSPKHGSGCVFSSALTAGLGRGFSMNKAVLEAKRYVERFISSNRGLLGYHKN